MAHEVKDTDLHFLIDPDTREITNPNAAKAKLIQFDHNSECFTFEVPRYVDTHDMSLCSKIEVHYINISGDKQNKHADVYPVTDVKISAEDETKVIFSWIISSGATQFPGSLSFLIRFCCLTEDKLDYAWHTTVFKGISIAEGMNNGEAVVTEYSDILAKWEADVLALHVDFAAEVAAASAAIEAKGAEVLASIPEEYTELSRQVADKFKGSSVDRSKGDTYALYVQDGRLYLEKSEV